MADINDSAFIPIDEEVIARVLGGEPQAFELLVERYKLPVAMIVKGKIPSDETQELVHEVFVRAFESLANYRPIRPFKNWLATIAVRTCYDFWRRRYRNREVPLTSLSPDQQNWLRGQPWQAEGDEAQNAVKNFETWEVLDWALGHISAEDRMVLIMVHIEGCPVAEVAKHLGWTVANVKVRAFRARKKLRKIIGQALS